MNLDDYAVNYDNEYGCYELDFNRWMHAAQLVRQLRGNRPFTENDCEWRVQTYPEDHYPQQEHELRVRGLLVGCVHANGDGYGEQHKHGYTWDVQGLIRTSNETPVMGSLGMDPEPGETLTIETMKEHARRETLGRMNATCCPELPFYLEIPPRRTVRRLPEFIREHLNDLGVGEAGSDRLQDAKLALGGTTHELLARIFGVPIEDVHELSGGAQNDRPFLEN
jgi:hypothetical protein